MDSAPAPTGIESTVDPLAGQPILRVERDGCRFTLLGTAHVSQASVDAVRALAERERFDAVAVELCEPRFRSLREPNQLAKLDLFRVVKEGKVGLVAANLALSAYQRRLAKQLGIEPGAEMRAAIEAAESEGKALWRIDRDVGTTLRRTYTAVGWWQRIKLMSGLLASLLVDEQVDADEIEKLKQGDMLESTFAEFASRSERLYGALIDERDRYMAARLREAAAREGSSEVLAVVGAGHLAGLSGYLRDSDEPPETTVSRLDALPPPGRWGTWIAIAIAALVIGGFAWGFARGVDVGTELLLVWVLATGGLGAIGCALAGGHPLSVIAAFLSSPLTPLHPLLSSGTVSALVEVTLRRPTVADFDRLKDDVGTVGGWWRNRVSRVLLNFFLTSTGTAIGVYIAGWRMLQALFD
ncbi:TraB/GumN family protein [Lysobacter sp. CAU 1642]|uniref:TraB/GumN family protein n=2 Tax=Pseudomarimonas salicorniae TaxID=2933270 RepID=A0ABT0GF43_9GAMM|nr:TraB/GumN family protein [Lysobacter sp. CAU 1642]